MSTEAVLFMLPLVCGFIVLMGYVLVVARKEPGAEGLASGAYVALAGSLFVLAALFLALPTYCWFLASASVGAVPLFWAVFYFLGTIVTVICGVFCLLIGSEKRGKEMSILPASNKPNLRVVNN
jgi:hypothetical protein